MLNFLYCFDKNYNNQAFTSMASLLDKVSEKINIFIIHKSINNEKIIPSFIVSHKNLNELKIYQYNSKIESYPNIENAHVSEATYYRIFFDEYLPKDLNHIIYLDSDFICGENPVIEIKKNLTLLLNSDFTVGAVTQTYKNEQNTELFERINMQSSVYFNAGFLVIDIESWKKNLIKDKFFEKLQNLEFDLKFWDQDLLNHIFDGNYLQLSKYLNFQMRLDKNIYEYIEFNEEEVLFYHFLGKQKPWVGRGLFAKNTEIYQKEYRKHSNKTYHIEHIWFLLSIKYLLRSFTNLSFFNIKYKSKFLYYFFSSLFGIKE